MRRVVMVCLLVVTAGILALTGSVSDSTPAPDAELIPIETAGFELVPFPLPPATCGGNICGPGTYCCNPSCGTCTPIGAYCTQQVCNPDS